jgi:hypothetical protein
VPGHARRVTEAKVARDGFDWVWLLSVWQTGEAGPDLAVGTPAREPIDRERESFYGRLLTVLRRPEVRGGQWALLEPRPAWDGAGGRLLAVVNFGPSHAQCYVRLAFGDFSGRSIPLTDLVHPTTRYERQGDAVTGTGLSLDQPPWGHHVFAVTVQSR